MQKIATLTGHTYRVLYLAVSVLLLFIARALFSRVILLIPA